MAVEREWSCNNAFLSKAAVKHKDVFGTLSTLYLHQAGETSSLELTES